MATIPYTLFWDFVSRMDAGIMATQGSTANLVSLLSAVQKENKTLVPEDKILFVFDPPGSYQKAIALVFNNPNYNDGGMDDTPLD